MYGTPIEVGNCARDILLERAPAYAAALAALAENSILRNELGSLRSVSGTSGLYDNLQPIALNPPPDVAVFIASDSPSSADQINSTMAWPGSVVFPKGCHIQLNPSSACLLETCAYWLLLSVSDVIVTQTDNRVPISAYSRYAAMYGLMGDSLRDGRNCSSVYSRSEMSRTHQGNWFCHSM